MARADDPGPDTDPVEIHSSLVELAPVAPTEERNQRMEVDFLASMQATTRTIALEPSGWNDERRVTIAEFFTALAPGWNTRAGPERLEGTRDALARGGVKTGLALEIGSGTGHQTTALREHFDHVVSIDLVAEMLALSPRQEAVSLVRGDASALPCRDGGADAIVCVNTFLFPAEYARALAPGGSVVVVSTNGDETPIYLSPTDIVAALEPALLGGRGVDGTAGGGSAVRAVTCKYKWSVWTVVTREDQ